MHRAFQDTHTHTHTACMRGEHLLGSSSLLERAVHAHICPNSAHNLVPHTVCTVCAWPKQHTPAGCCCPADSHRACSVCGTEIVCVLCVCVCMAEAAHFSRLLPPSGFLAVHAVVVCIWGGSRCVKVVLPELIHRAVLIHTTPPNPPPRIPPGHHPNTCRRLTASPPPPHTHTHNSPAADLPGRIQPRDGRSCRTPIAIRNLGQSPSFGVDLYASHCEAKRENPASQILVQLDLCDSCRQHWFSTEHGYAVRNPQGKCSRASIPRTVTCPDLTVISL